VTSELHGKRAPVFVRLKPDRCVALFCLCGERNESLGEQAMTDEERFSSGELHRLIERVDRNVEAMRKENKTDRLTLAEGLQAMAGQHIELKTRVATTEREIRDIKRDVRGVDDKADAAHAKVDGINNKALGVSLTVGAITAVIALLISLFKN
jgi:hypothetical protein